MTNTEWLLLQVIGDALAIWLCLLAYPHLRDFMYSKVDDGHDEHEDVDQDVDQVRG